MSAVNKYQKRQLPKTAVKDDRNETTAKSIENRLAWAAGTEQFSNRDPMFHLQESFKQVFDALGGRGFDGENPGGVFGQFMKEIAPGLTDAVGKKLSEQNNDTQNGLTSDNEKATALGKTSMAPYYRQRDMFSGDRLMTKFSEVTFNRGVMAGAILNGTGQMMLFNCLKRTVGQSQPKTIFQKKLSQQASAHRLVKGYPQDKLIFNKGFTDSAVGLVVDVLRDSRRVVDGLSAVVDGTAVNSKKGAGADTLEKMYPFLSTKKEELLLADYDKALAALGNSPQDNEKRQLLTRATERLNAMVEKKNQMKVEFVSKLRYISESAQKAQALFSTEDFKQSLFDNLANFLLAAVPPPSDDDDDNKKDKENQNSDGEQLHKKSQAANPTAAEKKKGGINRPH